MLSIRFFSPITYEKENTTGSERALERVEEYFYLGGKFRVSLFEEKLEGGSSRLYAMQNSLDRHRPWTNVAIKVVSYCTVVLPLVALLAKAALRYYLGVYSIKLKGEFAFASNIENKLPLDLLRLVVPFLEETDQSRLGATCYLLHNAVQKARDKFLRNEKLLIGRLKALPKMISFPQSFSKEDIAAAVKANQDFGSFLVNLIKADSLGYHHRSWRYLMHGFIRRTWHDFTIEHLIGGHAVLANFLAQSNKPISSSEIYHFCRYLVEKDTPAGFYTPFGFLFHAFPRPIPNIPWIFYRVLEQYSISLKDHAESINRAIKENLALQAKARLIATKGYRTFEVYIDPRDWFGFQGSRYSLWKSLDFGEENNQLVSMPNLLEDALFESIVSIKESRPDLQFMVSMPRKWEPEVPPNFVLSLARRITNEGIFFRSNKVDRSQLERPEFGGLPEFF